MASVENDNETQHTENPEIKGQTETKQSEVPPGTENNNSSDNKGGTEEEEEKEKVILVPEIIEEDVKNLPTLKDSPIRVKAESLSFPLSFVDQFDLVKLAKRYEEQEFVTSLSAPQIGIPKRAFVFEIEPDEDNEKEQTFKRNIWINPTYKNAEGATLDEDYECCFSIKNEDGLAAGPVFRFNRILYRAYDVEGRILEGEASGYAARVIQHEIDHLDGKLFADYVLPERLTTMSDYMERRENGTLEALQTGLVPEFL